MIGNAAMSDSSPNECGKQSVRNLVSVALIATSSLASAALHAQAPAPAATRLEFDIASIRENKSGMPWNGGDPSVSNVPYTIEPVYRETGGVFSATNWPIYNLVFFAYKTTSGQGPEIIRSLPEWTNTTLFNIEARTDNRNVTKDEMRQMMRSLLEDRFHIKVHTETREVPLYAVVLAKPGVLGPRLRPHPPGEACSIVAPPLNAPKPADGGPPPANTVRDDGFPLLCGSYVNMPAPPYHKREGSRDLPMEMIAAPMSNLGRLGRPTVDRTGLAGNYDWVIDFLIELPPGMDPPPGTQGQNFQDALRDQMGLKLKAIKGPFEYFIVDHIDHPTGN